MWSKNFIETIKQFLFSKSTDDIWSKIKKLLTHPIKGKIQYFLNLHWDKTFEDQVFGLNQKGLNTNVWHTWYTLIQGSWMLMKLTFFLDLEMKFHPFWNRIYLYSYLNKYLNKKLN